jgi:hypothetical protein
MGAGVERRSARLGEVHMGLMPRPSSSDQGGARGEEECAIHCNVNDEGVSVNDFVALIRSIDSTAEIRHVLVFRKDASTHLRRIEIDIKDQKQVPSRTSALAAALERSGIAYRALQDADLAANEIWLTLPHNGSATELVSWALLPATSSGD